MNSLDFCLDCGVRWIYGSGSSDADPNYHDCQAPRYRVLAYTPAEAKAATKSIAKSIDLEDMRILWEILVPTVQRVSGRPIRTRQHRAWDAKVRAISGGLTILAPVKGQWTSPNEEIFAERMIPVRIACTKPEMEKIAKMTIKFYDQLCVMYYKVSDEVHFVYSAGKKSS